MKVTRKLGNRVDILEIPTRLINNEMRIEITNNVGTPQVTGAVFFLRADLAQALIKSLYEGMRLDDPNGEIPVYSVDQD